MSPGLIKRGTVFPLSQSQMMLESMEVATMLHKEPTIFPLKRKSSPDCPDDYRGTCAE
ncbi:hypothetical protein J6590_092738 [Homalodisca vitripennis]|nr:hypothetical protein J6590_092738 [Homalodisca vitripennis]